MTMSVRSKSVTLRFPNQNSSFDDKGNRVRFCGYDSAIEISFFVEADALQKHSPEISATEDGCLKAFDAAQERIHEVTYNVYVPRDHKSSYAYTLAADDV